MRQKMRVTRTIRTTVEEKDWKSCPTCVMQVLLAFEEPDVLFKRQGGRESLNSLESLALIEDAFYSFFSFFTKTKEDCLPFRCRTPGIWAGSNFCTR